MAAIKNRGVLRKTETSAISTPRAAPAQSGIVGALQAAIETRNLAMRYSDEEDHGDADGEEEDDEWGR